MNFKNYYTRNDKINIVILKKNAIERFFFNFCNAN